MDTTQLRKSNDEIIKEARLAFKGQWSNVFLAFLLSSLVSAAIGAAVSAVLTVAYLILDFIFSYKIMEIVAVVLVLIGIIMWLIFQGRVWIWQTTFILKKSRGEIVSNTDFTSVFEGIRTVKDLKGMLLDKNNLLKNLAPSFTMLLNVLAILIGYILLVVPGIIISFMLVLVPFLAAEQRELSPIGVLKRSSALMYGNKMKLFYCYLKLLPLMILCLLPCGLGLIWFGPYLSFVLAKFYDAHK